MKKEGKLILIENNYVGFSRVLFIYIFQSKGCNKSLRLLT